MKASGKKRSVSDLREQICSCFNLSELKTLCFDLKIKYDDLSGENTLTDKTRELIAYCIRHQRLPDLLMYCQKARPKAIWADFDLSDLQTLNPIANILGAYEERLEKSPDIITNLEVDIYKSSLLPTTKIATGFAMAYTTMENYLDSWEEKELAKARSVARSATETLLRASELCFTKGYKKEIDQALIYLKTAIPFAARRADTAQRTIDLVLQFRTEDLTVSGIFFTKRDFNVLRVRLIIAMSEDVKTWQYVIEAEKTLQSYLATNLFNKHSGT